LVPGGGEAPVTGRQAGLLRPRWPAPPRVCAASTTRTGGVSQAPYDSLNLADHVGDDGRAVAENRAMLISALDLPAEPAWLRQVHGSRVIDAAAGSGTEADGSLARTPGVVCAVLTADCLPVLLCDEAGSRVAALHAGWRGLADGVIEAGVQAMQTPGARLLAWLGPAIGVDAFEVGDDVREAFCDADPAADAAFFTGRRAGRWQCDLHALARRRLASAGVHRIYGEPLCTYANADMFFSYRRDGRCGRMASLVWLRP
jgi:YfiH family protein